MTDKLFVVLTTLAVAASASIIHTAEPDLTSFAYDVADPNTGDFKSQMETRIGDNVRGQYSLLESDGTRRIVDYSAGDEGFNAVVRNEPTIISDPIVKAHVVVPAPALVVPYPPSGVYKPRAALPVTKLVFSRPVVSSTSTNIVTSPLELIAQPAVTSSKNIFPSYSSGVSESFNPSLNYGGNAPSFYASSENYPPSYTYANIAPQYGWWEK